MIAADRRGEKRQAPIPKPAFHPRKIFHASASRTGNSAPFICPLCANSHLLMRCNKFREKSIPDRRGEIRRLRLCFNCMGRHRVNVCPSSSRCTICQGKHHTLIHTDESGASQGPSSSAIGSKNGQDKPGTSSTVVALHAASTSSPIRKILLATARVLLVGPQGRSTYARALLDQGSEASFISESVAQLLELPKQRTCVPLSGLGASSAGTARSIARLILRSAVETTFQVETEMLVLPKLTSLIPSLDTHECLSLEQFSDIALADPEFAVAQKIDLILGADLYGQLLRPGLKRFQTSQLVAQNTILGWIVSGQLEAGVSRRAAGADINTSIQTFHCVPHDDLDQVLQRFWTLEEVPAASQRLKPEDEKCEKIFQENYTRNSQGRYVVSLPLKGELPLVAAESRRMALSSLSHMQRRFSRDPKLAQAYSDFMEAYERLGHMSRIPPSQISRPDAWYLPHHAVVQDAANNWKLRVVFDASRRTRDGYSLNSFLCTGPPLQSNLSLILSNWRRYRFAFTADVVKMFRQILVRPEYQDFQRIVWAPNAAVEPVDYRLTTVTYGTACAPYLAIRTLSQLVQDEGSRFPRGAHCILSETYVDDTFSGADDLFTAIQKKIELCDLLALAGIELDKWAANHPDLLPASVTSISEKLIEDDRTVKTLGVHWVPSQDKFRFNASGLEELSSAHTKRSILSNIARLFDPLGWLAPFTITAKVLMQDIWILKSDWDSPFLLKSVNAGVAADCSYQIHGFADASARAYAAVVYLRVDEGNDNFRVSLLTAKSKVAPVKTVSIPNLELCGAALLVKLILHVTKLEFLQKIPILPGLIAKLY